MELGRLIVDHAPAELARQPDDGFVMRWGTTTIEAERQDERWRVPGLAATLRRADSEEGGFVLAREDGGGEIGRTMAPLGVPEADLRYLLLSDGRLFRIVRGQEGGFDLLGWETPGAYLRARRTGRVGVWTLEPTVACSGLIEIRALSLLLAVEVLDREQPVKEG
jgi:hypothetical protein